MIFRNIKCTYKYHNVYKIQFYKSRHSLNTVIKFRRNSLQWRKCHGTVLFPDRSLERFRRWRPGECDLNLRSSCTHLCIREYMCRYVCAVSTYACTYVSDSRRQLDSIDAVAHLSLYAYTRMHPRIKGGIGCSFVLPRYKSGLPEQSMIRYRSELDIGRDLDGCYSKLFLQVTKKDFLPKAYGNIVREDTFNSFVCLIVAQLPSPSKVVIFYAKKNARIYSFCHKEL